MIVNVDTRVNDQFVIDDSICCQPPSHDITSNLVEGQANATRFQAAFYKHVSLDIVVETVFDYPYPYISEKTLRPISCKRMFIVIGAAGTLQLLKDKGFMTWADLIDESYDCIQDPMQRFLAVTKSIKEFCSLPLSQVKEFMVLNKSRFESNFQNLFDLKQQELAQLRLNLLTA
jgi:hypothetical protein